MAAHFQVFQGRHKRRPLRSMLSFLAYTGGGGWCVRLTSRNTTYSSQTGRSFSAGRVHLLQVACRAPGRGEEAVFEISSIRMKKMGKAEAGVQVSGCKVVNDCILHARYFGQTSLPEEYGETGAHCQKL